MIKISFVLILLILRINDAWTSYPFLMIKDKPLSPFCISQALLSESRSIQCSACMKEFLKHYNEVDESEPTSYPEDTYKICIKNKEENFTESHAYKYLGSYKKNEIVLYFSRGEGSGNDSFLYVLNLKKDELSVVETIAGGDRAWGFINDATLESDVVTYTQSLNDATIAPHLGVSKDVSKKLYDCAVCDRCIATFTYNLCTQKNTLIKLELLLNETSDKSLNPYQEEFNKVFTKQFNAQKIIEGEDLEHFKITLCRAMNTST